MFHFESLELLYWDCWERVKIPLDARIITVVGPNGSGKTTLLDALRTLLAAKTSQKRDYKKYARRPNKPHSWITGVVTNNRDSKSKPPFFPITSDKVTLACHINKKGGDWQRSYYIIPKTPSIEEIMTLAENPPDPYYKPKGVRDYQTELEKAGLSDAMLTVLSLEQGATDKLCEYRPKEILQLVYAAFGDKPTLDNYEKAVIDQTEAEKELEGMRLKVDRLDSQCTALTNRVNNYKEYDRLNSSRIKLETEVLAQAQYVEVHDSIKGANSSIKGLKNEIAKLKDEKKSLTENEKQVSIKDAKLEDGLETIETSLKNVQTALREEDSNKSVIQTRLKEIDKLRDACKGIKEESIVALQSKIEDVSRKKYSIEQKRKDVEQKIKDLQGEIKSLQANRLMPDKSIELFHQKLANAGIQHSFLYENIEILDEKWRVAVESILKEFRYVILMKDASLRRKTWEMGEQDDYRHFILGEDKRGEIDAPEGSALNVVKLSDKVPGWVGELLSETQLIEKIEDGQKLREGAAFVTKNGFAGERRGGRSIAVHGADFAFGELGRKKRLQSLKKQVEELLIEKNNLDKFLTETDSEISEINKRINQQKMLQEYLSKKAEGSNLKNELQNSLKKIDDLERKQERLYKEKKAINEGQLKVIKELTEVRKDLELVIKGLSQREENFKRQRRDRVERYKEFRILRKDMPESWRTDEALENYKKKFEDRKQVQREIERTEKQLNEGTWEKDPSIITMKEKVEKDYLGEKSELEKKEKEISETIRLTQDARSAYIDYLRASIRFYEKNLKKLADIAGVGIDVNKPHLENNDMVLKEAGLEVKWNFDNKGFTKTDDGEGSGGQQVMKSLILLLALLMAEGESSGFVFIDEPFAHLDVFNIDKVTEFLLATNTQYIITSPNTHNTNIYRSAFLTLVTRKKRPDKQFADPPGHLKRLDN